MYYSTIINNLESTATIKKSDFATAEVWDSYVAIMRNLQNTLVAWRNDSSEETRNAFFNALKEFYSTISSDDGIKRENQYVPQSAEVEVARYGFISANVKTRKRHNAESLKFEDEVVIPLMRKERTAALKLSLCPNGMHDENTTLKDYHEECKIELNIKRKECEKLMDVYKQVEPMSEQAFRKGFETALAEAIVGKKMMTVAERNAMQKATKDANNAKKKLIEAEVRVEVAKAE